MVETSRENRLTTACGSRRSAPPLRDNNVGRGSRMSRNSTALEDHVHRFFGGHEIRARSWTRGPLAHHESFRVLEIAPGPVSGHWNYASVGAGGLHGSDFIEFLLTCPQQTERATELVAMAAYYHSTEGLGIGHTLPIGEPWLPGASCDHFLVSLPYPFGPSLEVANYDDREHRFLWLLPITADEREFKRDRGQEQLERLFDSQQIEYWNPDRPSVVPKSPAK